MLQAKTEKGNMIILSQYTLQEINVMRKHQRFYCPVCHEQVMIKAGSKVIPHFAHYSKSNCPSNHGEGPYHEKGKFFIYNWLSSQKLQVALEPFLKETNQFPDIFLTYQQRYFAIEYQCARLDFNLIYQRHMGYLEQDIIPIWILGANQFNRLGRNYLHVNGFIQQFIHQFAAHLPLSLYFFCPETLQLVTFKDLYFTRSQTAIGSFQFRKLYELRFRDLFISHELPKTVLYRLWEKEKQKFRMLSRPFINNKEREWQQWLYYKNIPIQHLPSLVYLPVPSQYLMKSSLWDWQSRIVLDLLQPLKVGSLFHRKRCNLLLKDHVYSTDVFPLISKPQNPIDDYLHLLEQLRVIERVSSHEYRKIETIQFPMHIEEAMIHDQLVLKQLKNSKIQT